VGSAANRTAAAGSFAVFFDGPGAFGTHPVYAIAAEHAVEIASAFYPGSRLAAGRKDFVVSAHDHQQARIENRARASQYMNKTRLDLIWNNRPCLWILAFNCRAQSTN
jgi:hypothetical protein